MSHADLATPTLGTRQTRQREVIFEVLRQAPGPLPVPEIHQRAGKLLPTLGLATVYRALKLLLASESVQSLVLPSGETRYKIAGSGHHDHFQCRACHQVFELQACPIHLAGSACGQGAALPHGFRVEDHAVTLYGLCDACAPA